METIIDYKNRINHLGTILPYLTKVDHSFTVPEIFNKSYDENFISKYFSYILDPKKNGIGFEPIEKIILFFRPEYDVRKIDISKKKIGTVLYFLLLVI